MRFKSGQVGGADGELQTAVVSYRKRFPWSLLHPSLEFDLCRLIWCRRSILRSNITSRPFKDDLNIMTVFSMRW